MPRRRLRHAFINIPYAPTYEPLLLAYITGACAYGFVPSAAPDIPGSTRQLERILHLLRRSALSFHELSYVKIDNPAPPTPRFNMPFELGLAVALATWKKSTHQWFVFEAQEHRFPKSLSDLSGTRVYAHKNNPLALLSKLTSALAEQPHRPTLRHLKAIFRDVKHAAGRIKKDLGVRDIFDTRPFNDTVIAAVRSAQKHIQTLSPPRKRKRR